MNAQEGTEGAMKRIGEVLREHELGWSSAEGFHCISIICDWYGHDLDFPEHRAELIIEALGLTPELLHLNEYAAANGAEPEIQTRWVTKWEQQA